jgi:hypothetical protein
METAFIVGFFNRKESTDEGNTDMVSSGDDWKPEVKQ